MQRTPQLICTTWPRSLVSSSILCKSWLQEITPRPSYKKCICRYIFFLTLLSHAPAQSCLIVTNRRQCLKLSSRRKRTTPCHHLQAGYKPWWVYMERKLAWGLSDNHFIACFCRLNSAAAWPPTSQRWWCCLWIILLSTILDCGKDGGRLCNWDWMHLCSPTMDWFASDSQTGDRFLVYQEGWSKWPCRDFQTQNPFWYME